MRASRVGAVIAVTAVIGAAFAQAPRVATTGSVIDAVLSATYAMPVACPKGDMAGLVRLACAKTVMPEPTVRDFIDLQMSALGATPVLAWQFNGSDYTRAWLLDSRFYYSVVGVSVTSATVLLIGWGPTQ